VRQYGSTGCGFLCLLLKTEAYLEVAQTSRKASVLCFGGMMFQTFSLYCVTAPTKTQSPAFFCYIYLERDPFNFMSIRRAIIFAIRVLRIFFRIQSSFVFTEFLNLGISNYFFKHLAVKLPERCFLALGKATFEDLQRLTTRRGGESVILSQNLEKADAERPYIDISCVQAVDEYVGYHHHASKTPHGAPATYNKPQFGEKPRTTSLLYSQHLDEYE
jgi:hypothetical protein